ncbi:hypothetical protein RRG08_005087 [Elysia crispata]|uniref:Uncharacterized protein n=1 Tax=Elysia crispata TaxID=231223 RepID=A0AAE0XZ45_9GAST|nr:hypothetical protein RRG08_005087 [Elysia crispata]
MEAVTLANGVGEVSGGGKTVCVCVGNGPLFDQLDKQTRDWSTCACGSSSYLSLLGGPPNQRLVGDQPSEELRHGGKGFSQTKQV